MMNWHLPTYESKHLPRRNRYTRALPNLALSSSSAALRAAAAAVRVLARFARCGSVLAGQLVAPMLERLNDADGPDNRGHDQREHPY